MSNEIKVLTVDDEEHKRELYSIILKKEGYVVDGAESGEEALAKIRQTKYNLVLLDIMMEPMNGMEALKEMRKFTNVPVIMLSSKGEIIDKHHALEAGADDYIVKGTDNLEFTSRVRAVLRRSQTEIDAGKELTIDNLNIDVASYVVKLGGVEIDMTPKEIELLYFLATHPQKMYTRDDLIKNLWEKDKDYDGDTRTVDVHIKRIRQKLGENNKRWYIETVWGKGYKFVVTSE